MESQMIVLNVEFKEKEELISELTR